MMDTTEKPRVEKMTEPSRAWKNWWCALETHTAYKPGSSVIVHHPKGEIYSGDRVWPSKELAEQGALNNISNPNCTAGRGWAEYLGAYAVTQ